MVSVVERDEHEGSKVFIGELTVLGGILYYKFSR